LENGFNLWQAKLLNNVVKFNQFCNNYKNNDIPTFCIDRKGNIYYAGKIKAKMANS